jgi:hypothetical protein
MAVEQRRLCGWRRVGSLYLCGKYILWPGDQYDDVHCKARERETVTVKSER